MLNKTLKTPVDDLVQIIKKNKDCTISFLTQKMNLPTEDIEKWIVILEEYKVLKLTYKGFEGYVRYIENQKDLGKEKLTAQQINIDNLKETFVQKSKLKGFSDTQMKQVWPEFVSHYMNEIREMFFELAVKKGYDNVKIAQAWDKYKEELLKL